MAVSAEIVRQLLALAREEDKRKLDWPHDWRPHEVTNPEDGQPFTNASAWEFVIRLLEGNADGKVVSQRKPPGATAYVFRAVMADGWTVYVKLRFNKNRSVIFGRSFHYDERQIRDD